MYNYSEIKTVHLEISTLCNAKCPMCLRNISGGKTNPQLPLKDLRIDEIKSIFSPSFIKQLKRIYLCGNYGDPMMGRDTLLAFEYFRAQNQQLKLEIFSNGSGRDSNWWAGLARLNVKAHFGIDGIGKTNEIYRRNTNFEKIIENIRAFIAAGGLAHWDFIVFKHNENQIDQAKRLSEELGFQSFRTKKTGRFFSNQKGQVKASQEVLNDAGEVEYLLEAPSNPEFFNSSLMREQELKNKHGSFDEYLDQTPISCKVQKEKSIYISAEGLVFPCCWTGIQLYPWYSKPQSSQVWEIINRMEKGKSSISALDQSIEKIIGGPFFQKDLLESWKLKSVREGKLKVCSRICGQEFDPFKDQFSENSERKF